MELSNTHYILPHAKRLSVVSVRGEGGGGAGGGANQCASGVPRAAQNLNRLCSPFPMNRLGLLGD